jgi:hypothetical protein
MTESIAGKSSSDDAGGEPALIDARLRGDALGGADQRSSVGHVDYEKTRKPNLELRLDGEHDSLHGDGLDIGDDSESYAGTDGSSPKGIKG